MNDPAASGRGSDKYYLLKAVASVTLDPNGNNFRGQHTLSRQMNFACRPYG